MKSPTFTFFLFLFFVMLSSPGLLAQPEPFSVRVTFGYTDPEPTAWAGSITTDHVFHTRRGVPVVKFFTDSGYAGFPPPVATNRLMDMTPNCSTSPCERREGLPSPTPRPHLEWAPTGETTIRRSSQ